MKFLDNILKPEQESEPQLRGMSQKPDLIKSLSASPKQLSLPTIPINYRKYLNIVMEDIKSIFNKDKESLKRQQEHKDFMENYFGGNR